MNNLGRYIVEFCGQIEMHLMILGVRIKISKMLAEILVNQNQFLGTNKINL